MTTIEWTDVTWNPLTGCAHVSEGCDNCYAAREASGRLKHHPAYEGLAAGGKFTGEVRLHPDRLDQPLRWRKPRLVFVNSMSDLFHDDVPAEFIVQVFATMSLAQRHTFQILTKRPARMARVLGRLGSEGRAWGGKSGIGEGEVPWPLPNVWLGTSVENQKWADVRIPHLLRTPAAVRFLSCEPLLGRVDLNRWLQRDRDVLELLGETIDWVIVGGESGPGARGMDLAWARALVGQCRAAGVPPFVKQLGARPYESRVIDDIGGRPFESRSELRLRDKKGGDIEEWPEDLRVREMPRPAQVVADHALEDDAEGGLAEEPGESGWSAGSSALEPVSTLGSSDPSEADQSQGPLLSASDDPSQESPGDVPSLVAGDRAEGAGAGTRPPAPLLPDDDSPTERLGVG